MRGPPFRVVRIAGLFPIVASRALLGALHRRYRRHRPGRRPRLRSLQFGVVELLGRLRQRRRGKDGETESEQDSCGVT
jgi:hypothetical protein